MALNKPLDQISEDDLQVLVTDKVAEKKTIEYKGIALPGNTDSEKKEFLADVSSFANAAGGHLVYGIKEDGGMPVEVCGVEIDDVDAAIRRLDNLMRDGISPRLPGPPPIQPVMLPSKSRHYAVIIRIQRSWAQPHRVIYQNHGHFYSRNSAGKYQLDVSELRTAFDLSGTTAERIRNFRTERLSKIVAGETPALLDEKAPKLVLHIVPFSAFDLTSKFDLSFLNKPENYEFRKPLTSWENPSLPAPRYNLDGLLSHAMPGTAGVYSYLQFFRNGAIEAVDTTVLTIGLSQPKLIHGLAFDQKLLDTVIRYFGTLKMLNVEPPLFVTVSLLGVKGYSIEAGESSFQSGYPIDRANLNIPEIIVEQYNDNVPQVMKPTLNTIWNAAGWERSMSYDQAGKLK